MPPPLPAALPLRIVTPVISSVARPPTVKTRSMPPPSMIVWEAPAPVMVSDSPKPLTFRSPPWNAVRMKMPAGNVIVSAPARAFASWIAARRVQAPGVAIPWQTPSPGSESASSKLALTVKAAARPPPRAKIRDRPIARATTARTAAIREARPRRLRAQSNGSPRVPGHAHARVG